MAVTFGNGAYSPHPSSTYLTSHSGQPFQYLTRPFICPPPAQLPHPAGSVLIEETTIHPIWPDCITSWRAPDCTLAPSGVHHILEGAFLKHKSNVFLLTPGQVQIFHLHGSLPRPAGASPAGQPQVTRVQRSPREGGFMSPQSSSAAAHPLC